MKLNKKGFTLIELLAVIVILAALSLVAVPAITRLIQSSKEKAFLSQAKTFIEAAQTQYATDTTPADCYVIGDLKIEKGSTLSPVTNSQLTGYIKAEYTNGEISGWKAYITDYKGNNATDSFQIQTTTSDYNSAKDSTTTTYSSCPQ